MPPTPRFSAASAILKRDRTNNAADGLGSTAEPPTRTCPYGSKVRSTRRLSTPHPRERTFLRNLGFGINVRITLI